MLHTPWNKNERNEKIRFRFAHHRCSWKFLLLEESLFPTSDRFYYRLANLKRARLILLVGRGSWTPLSVNVNHSHGKHHALASAFNPCRVFIMRLGTLACLDHRSIRSWCFEIEFLFFFSFFFPMAKWNSRNFKFERSSISCLNIRSKSGGGERIK